MMRTDILLLILGMAVVTYIPRALPAVRFDMLRFGAIIENCLVVVR